MAGLSLSPAETSLARIVMAVRQLMEGRSNAVGSFTLAVTATSTTVSAPNCSAGSKVLFSAETANAAGAMATTYVPPATVTAGQFIVNHASAATTDRTFSYETRG